MHGIGNDFVVLDCRREALSLDAAAIARLGDRHIGVGFDQLLTIEPARDAACAFRYGIYNRDGSEAGQCGNGVRCVAAWLRRDGALGPGLTRLQSPSGAVAVEILDDGRVRVDMGVPAFAPAAIPLRESAEALRYRRELGAVAVEFGALSMGNPHAVIEVADTVTAAVAQWGPALETHADFPDRANIGFAQVMSPAQIRLRVWERGVGETLACGSGACAAAVVLNRLGRVSDVVEVQLPGGTLHISWAGPGAPVWMTGPAAFVFDGNYQL
ncbi:diaminopimelate epimerase [Tahibacter aquaticus]|uniref:Diaminopimelate epimerase n=1 Tax=Tahibacter aquaticus TaxID=520092 RepID=A0A4V3DLU4_9GAMM|nr:diaminopimelate epimerase [Tahibacter aquaticus]TDR41294.1 diaminopimelate epimerase [Tahibacter aquaticus]